MCTMPVRMGRIGLRDTQVVEESLVGNVTKGHRSLFWEHDGTRAALLTMLLLMAKEHVGNCYAGPSVRSQSAPASLLRGCDQSMGPDKVLERQTEVQVPRLTFGV